MTARSGAQSAEQAVEFADEAPRSYRDLLKAANLSRDEIKALNQVRDGRAWRDLFATLATTAAVPVLYLAFPNPLTVVACIVLSLHNFNALTQIGHASGHGNFVSQRRWNVAAGEIACALRGFSRAGFSLSHHIHHIKLNTAEDPDLIWGQPQESTREILGNMLRDLFMITAIKRLLQYMQFDRKSYDATPWRRLSPRFFAGKIGAMLPIAGAHALLLVYYWALIGPEYYLYFYVLPIVTLYPAQIRWRSACEHSFDPGYRPRAAETVWVTRSTQSNAVGRFVIAPLGSNYHLEHHLLPGVPYYNLPAARRVLERKGIVAPLAAGYFGYLFGRWRREHELARGASAA